MVYQWKRGIHLVKVSTVGGAFGLYTHSDELLCFGPIENTAEGADAEYAAKAEEEDEKRIAARVGHDYRERMKVIFQLIGDSSDNFGYIDFDKVTM